MEYKVAWGVAFDLSFNKDAIQRICKGWGIPYPERLIISNFSDRYVVGYTFLPVIDEMDIANVAILEKWSPSWYSERLKDERRKKVPDINQFLEGW